MSFFSDIAKLAAPAVATVAPFVPGGQPFAVAASLKVAADRQAALKFQQEKAKIQRTNNMDPLLFNQFGSTTSQAGVVPQQGFFDRLGSAASRVGDTLLTGFESAIPSLINRQIFGQRPASAAQGPALTTVTNVGAQESQGSGSIQAGAGNLLAPLLQAGRALLKSPGGQLAIGTGTGLAFSGMGSSSGGMRMTRKMKSQARMVLNMTGGNLQAAADMLGIDQQMLVMLLLKRFRNDGPVVTKAALRKTKQTIRRLHSMQDVLKSITPTATARRRAPMKRATTTLIKN